MSAADDLPRIWASRRRVYIEWPQFGDGVHTTVVINLGTYLDDVVAWLKAVPRDAVPYAPAPAEDGDDGEDGPG